jgi:hypothetical protein
VKGYIYVLTNPAMPGLVKIGRSIHGGKKRAEQLDCTAVPLPFEVFFEMTFTELEEAELAIHEALANHRVNRSREFFSMPPEAAARAVIDEWLRESGHSIMHDCDHFVLHKISQYSHAMKASPDDLIEAFGYFNEVQIAEAIEKVHERAIKVRAANEAKGL